MTYVYKVIMTEKCLTLFLEMFEGWNRPLEVNFLPGDLTISILVNSPPEGTPHMKQAHKAR